MIRYKADARIFSSLLASSPGWLCALPSSSWCKSHHSGDHRSQTHLKEKEENTMPELLWEHREATLGTWWKEAC